MPLRFNLLIRSSESQNLPGRISGGQIQKNKDEQENAKNDEDHHSDSF